MYKHILLPLDGSALAEQALPHALAQAERFEAELTLLKVIEPLPRRGTSMSQAAFERAEEEMKTWAREYLEGVAGKLQEQGISVQTATPLDEPHRAIVRLAERNQVDLIVMCTRGQSGISRWLMGSVADRVVRGAKVPVLLVRALKK
jgi:nucleotide-binding universal stress UspA family protein